jgi:hypothetical protein
MPINAVFLEDTASIAAPIIVGVLVTWLLVNAVFLENTASIDAPIIVGVLVTCREY